MAADLVLYNGVVHTQDPHGPQASALAVRGDRVLAVGDDQSARDLRRSGGAAVDLKGKCAIPGLVDAHVHFELWALGQQQVDAEAATLEEVLQRVAARARRVAPGTWVLGWGWSQDQWGGAFPTRQMLDRVAPEHPVFLRAKSGHAGWASSRAMQLAGVDRSAADPESGQVLRGADGEATGIFLEAAQGLIDRAVPEPSLAEVVSAMAQGQEQALAAGLTGVHDLDGVRALQAWQVLREQGRMRLRVHKSIPASLLDEALAVGLRAGLGDEWLRLGGVKFFADGALGPHTAWMLAPYCGEPDNCGMPLTEMEELARQVSRASAGGLAVLVHAIGDRANRQVLDILARVRAEEAGRGERRLRHRVEHVQLLHPDDWGRLAELDLIASMQPLHATSDMEVAQRCWGRRTAGAYAWRTLRECGAVLAFGSDAPVESIAPLAGLHAAATRRRADGTPGPEGWRPEQRLSVAEALQGYTVGPAYASGEEQDRGILAPGRLADLVVLDRDLFRVPPMEILQARVLGTMVGGAWAFVAPDFDCG